MVNAVLLCSNEGFTCHQATHHSEDLAFLRHSESLGTNINEIALCHIGSVLEHWTMSLWEEIMHLADGFSTLD